jgi:hypothetical protein
MLQCICLHFFDSARKIVWGVITPRLVLRVTFQNTGTRRLSNVNHYVLKNFLSCEDTGLSSIIRSKPLFGICLHDFNVIHINGSLPVQLTANDTQGKIIHYKI